MKKALKGQNSARGTMQSECLDVFLRFIFCYLQQSKKRNQGMPRISPICDVTRGGGVRLVLLEDTLILTQLFKVTFHDT